ncbi:uncharacterized protein LOC130369507 [Hyla sarda]|uniref:uncharacterized protein LOC130273371 n=1 Tax=Hyla sarda TaxID=327740 RepID=UPI0024C21593|nr:uncharacterized protein LOC130273369 isoform X2 [Hyla sarda]XP_056376041.1 uncharacterized protein LOC130273370 isoform X2 [Hyla sarda]XP_056376042.1 uncharacterized protein LOC130273371 [Hyla sarda]XP_056376043.1 uncharacterized protein LOC130273372 [Hyla sarda]XP_056382206.1 uncharacterized protein LOC130276614 [Hyla sarda]XP_056430825.1 uncharacterized protein LOC130369506 [Hyla sarda]XP_056430826.1 uncharacterized protein LOC130369507 [Hyla sarda]
MAEATVTTLPSFATMDLKNTRLNRRSMMFDTLVTSTPFIGTVMSSSDPAGTVKVNDFEQMKSLFFELEKLSAEETHHQLDSAFLKVYLNEKLVPRGLRLRPIASFKEDTEFYSKWEYALNFCSSTLLQLLSEKRDSVVDHLSDKIDNCIFALSKFQHLPEYTEWQLSHNTKSLKLEKEILQKKLTKLNRDRNDYQNNNIKYWLKTDKPHDGNLTYSKNKNINNKTNKNKYPPRSLNNTKTFRPTYKTTPQPPSNLIHKTTTQNTTPRQPYSHKPRRLNPSEPTHQSHSNSFHKQLSTSDCHSHPSNIIPQTSTHTTTVHHPTINTAPSNPPPQELIEFINSCSLNPPKHEPSKRLPSGRFSSSDQDSLLDDSLLTVHITTPPCSNDPGRIYFTPMENPPTNHPKLSNTTIPNMDLSLPHNQHNTTVFLDLPRRIQISPPPMKPTTPMELVDIAPPLGVKRKDRGDGDAGEVEKETREDKRKRKNKTHKVVQI